MPHVVFRPHDDHDGDLSQGLLVAESPDGDFWVRVQGDPIAALRFRMPFVGGGRSPHTWEALKVLQHAMALDNDPQMMLPWVDGWAAQHPDSLLRAVADGERTMAGGEVDVGALAAEVLALRQRLRTVDHLRAVGIPPESWA